MVATAGTMNCTTGTNRTTPQPTDPPMVWNAMQALDRAGTVVASYDKAHLVPFGEYLPFRAVLGRLGMSKVTAGSIDFSAGPGPRTIDLPGLPPVGPLICYEVLFPAAVVEPGRRPEWPWYRTSMWRSSAPTPR